METEKSLLHFHTSVQSKAQSLSWQATYVMVRQVLNVLYLTLSEMLVALLKSIAPVPYQGTLAKRTMKNKNRLTVAQ